MLRALHSTDEKLNNSNWLNAFFLDFRRRFISLLSFQFSTFHPSLALSIISNKNVDVTEKSNPLFTVTSSYRVSQNNVLRIVLDQLDKTELGVHLTMYDIRRLEMYCRNLVDYHLIVDLVPCLSRLYFLQKMGDVHLSAAQAVRIFSESFPVVYHPE